MSEKQPRLTVVEGGISKQEQLLSLEDAYEKALASAPFGGFGLIEKGLEGKEKLLQAKKDVVAVEALALDDLIKILRNEERWSEENVAKTLIALNVAFVRINEVKNKT